MSLLCRVLEQVKVFSSNWEGFISTWALVATLVAVIWYTVKTSAMAKANQAMAEANDAMARATEAASRTAALDIKLRQRPVVVCSVAGGVNSMGILQPQSFKFGTMIYNTGIVHAKVRVRATVIFGDRTLQLPDDSLYNGVRTLEMQAQTGVRGHLDFENLFPQNGFPVDKIEEWRFPANVKKQLRVRLESWVVYYYDPDSQFTEEYAKNPSAYFMWKGKFRMDAMGQWMPEYDVKDFEPVV